MLLPCFFPLDKLTLLNYWKHLTFRFLTCYAHICMSLFKYFSMLLNANVLY